MSSRHRPPLSLWVRPLSLALVDSCGHALFKLPRVRVAQGHTLALALTPTSNRLDGRDRRTLTIINGPGPSRPPSVQWVEMSYNHAITVFIPSTSSSSVPDTPEVSEPPKLSGVLAPDLFSETPTFPSLICNHMVLLTEGCRIKQHRDVVPGPRLTSRIETSCSGPLSLVTRFRKRSQSGQPEVESQGFVGSFVRPSARQTSPTLSLQKTGNHSISTSSLVQFSPLKMLMQSQSMQAGTVNFSPEFLKLIQMRPFPCLQHPSSGSTSPTKQHERDPPPHTMSFSVKFLPDSVVFRDDSTSSSWTSTVRIRHHLIVIVVSIFNF
ncbi:hypothetical protein BGY98DRAFT_1167856 [Russula aff. rugulosa BPL654]|nr:hypothetical protein BGY98DRAFT_1167856 [Russula aff. rugulosa BPL654]